MRKLLTWKGAERKIRSARKHVGGADSRASTSSIENESVNECLGRHAQAPFIKVGRPLSGGQTSLGSRLWSHVSDQTLRSLPVGEFDPFGLWVYNNFNIEINQLLRRSVWYKLISVYRKNAVISHHRRDHCAHCYYYYCYLLVMTENVLIWTVWNNPLKRH